MNEVKILLTGAGGRMGKAVYESVKTKENVKVIAGVDVAPIQAEFPVYMGICEVPADLGCDVIVDFSHHCATKGILEYAEKAKCAAIICTTGHTEEEIEMISEYSKKIPVFRSGNMSLGINLLMALVKNAAEVLNGYDIEIIEKHHNQKLDAPSGTALMLAKSAEEGLDYEPVLTYDRHSVRKKRDKNEIGMHSVRGGTIVGEHEVLFAGPNETLTLTHSAYSREVFAEGAVKAAVFMKNRKAGLYTMQDVIKEIL